MEVLTILKCASTYLGLTSAFDYYFNESNNTTPSASVQSDYNLLLLSLNLVAKEICSEYKMVKNKEIVTFDSDKKFDPSGLSLTLDEVLKIKHNGVLHKFKMYDGVICSDFEGVAEIEYTFVPDDFDDSDDIDFFAGKIAERTLALGACREYKFIKRILDEAEVFEKRFYESLRGDLKQRKHVLMPAKRWY